MKKVIGIKTKTEVLARDAGGPKIYAYAANNTVYKLQDITSISGHCMSFDLKGSSRTSMHAISEKESFSDYLNNLITRFGREVFEFDNSSDFLEWASIIISEGDCCNNK